MTVKAGNVNRERENLNEALLRQLRQGTDRHPTALVQRRVLT